MRHSLSLGKILGVKINVHWTFILLIGWIIINGLRKGLPLNAFLWTFGITLVLFGCIVLHELAHALAARRFNIQTRDITLLPIGGVAQLESIPEKPKQELLIAIAGPAVNLIIAAILLPFVNIQTLLQPDSLTNINSVNFIFTIIVVNVWLAVFNLIPAFPMDGGRVLRATLSFWLAREKATKIAAAIGQGFGVVFFIAGFVYNPVLIFIGLMIFLGGQYEYVLVDTLKFLQSFTVNDVLMREVPTLANNLTLKEAGGYLLYSQNKNFVVVDSDKPVGTINSDGILAGLHEKGEATPLEKIMNQKLTYVNASMALDEAWKIMRDKKTDLLLVGANGHLDGIVDEDNLSEFIKLRSVDHLKRKH